MARRSLKPQLNQIRAWVRQGRTDAWIAHQLEISASELREFRKQHDLTADEEDGGATDVDLRDEIEAEVEAATAEEADEEEAPEEEAGEEGDWRRRSGRGAPAAATAARQAGRPRPAQRAGSDFRPRRDRGLRPLARSGRQGQPRVRRALGGPARGHG
jgi:hypothetical protein